MTTTRRRPRALGATALAVGLVLVAGACSADGEPWPVLSYTVDDAGTSLTLHAEVTDGDTVRAAVVSENANGSVPEGDPITPRGSAPGGG